MSDECAAIGFKNRSTNREGDTERFQQMAQKTTSERKSVRII